jgi:predicted RNA-binding Zn-ribbon protein involved in translation (DUF1610 family)
MDYCDFYEIFEREADSKLSAATASQQLFRYYVGYNNDTPCIIIEYTDFFNMINTECYYYFVDEARKEFAFCREISEEYVTYPWKSVNSVSKIKSMVSKLTKEMLVKKETYIKMQEVVELLKNQDGTKSIKEIINSRGFRELGWYSNLMAYRQQSPFKSLVDNYYKYKHLESYKETNFDIESEQVEDESPYSDIGRVEGRVIFSNRRIYERDPSNRIAAIAYHGTKCKICGFDFERTYGDRGKGFIEIHHKNLLSSTTEETIIDPKTDLVPVCPNCHSMIHRCKDSVLSIGEMIQLVNKQRKVK